jgi:polar amino acid transport system substrate-binding protein
MRAHISRDIVEEFSPTGTLRASINLGNPILAGQDEETDMPFGVSVDLAREFARRLGLGVELVLFDTAGKAAEALANEEVDIGFMAIDPVRGRSLRFTAPYLLIEGCYLVREAAPLITKDDVDKPHNRVTVGAGSAYDLFLTRELKHAAIVRAATSPQVVDLFVRQQLEVAAGVRQQLEQGALRYPGLRMLEGNFMTIAQAMALPKARSDGAWSLLCDFVEDMKIGGAVAAALGRHCINGVAVAPACDKV